MKEKLYEIPVNDAFAVACECPLCQMYNKLEQDAVAFTMGPSYMEDDIRAETDELGFCAKHAEQVQAVGNSLGMALVLKTHFDKVISHMKQQMEESQPRSRQKSLFKKSEKKADGIADYVHKLNASCYICNRIDTVFDRYVDTIYYLWKDDAGFREQFSQCNGFCTNHYGMLLEHADHVLHGAQLEEFTDTLNQLYITNMERVCDDLAWFINKFDYKYADEPWNNAKDAIPRAMTKDNSIL